VERKTQALLDAEPQPPWVKTSVAPASFSNPPGETPLSVTSGTLAAADINIVPVERQHSPETNSSTPTPRGGGVWPGSRDVVSTPLARGEVLRGEFILNRPMGTCEVHTTGAPLWGFVAPALGFRVTMYMLAEDDSWTSYLSMHGRAHGAKRGDFKYNTMRDLPSTKVDVVFTEPNLLPPEGVYWIATRARHVFHRKELGIRDEKSLGRRPPSGWRETYFQEHHDGVGGGTNGEYQVAMWSRIDDPAFKYGYGKVLHNYAGSVRPCLNALHTGIECLPPPSWTAIATKGDTTALDDGTFHPDGLFPVDEGDPVFRVPSHLSSTGWLQRSLKSAEIMALWNLPITFIDKVDDVFQSDFAKSSRLSPPCKVLFEIGSALLDSVDRGGVKGQVGNWPGLDGERRDGF
jgi:hypothetical protein